jgi:hypothetical protein
MLSTIVTISISSFSNKEWIPNNRARQNEKTGDRSMKNLNKKSTAFLPFVYPMLPVSGLSFLDCPFGILSRLFID